ncbi:MAG: iron-containing alcohol dehydrogenase, partial [Acutalibacteraceae bacterium]
NDVFHPEEVALEGIARIKAYFASLGMPTTLAELGVKEEDIKELANTHQGKFVELCPEDIEQIYELAK